MTGADWALWVAMATLAYLALLGWQLVRGVWSGRAPRLTRASTTVALVLVVASVLSLPRANNDLTLVASVATGAPVAPDGDALSDVMVTGNRVRLAGGHVEDASDVWAMIEDPRTGAFWLQGPAVQDGAHWTLDLVVGPESTPTGPLPYRVSVTSVHAGVSDAWLSAAQQGLLRLPAPPPGQLWLARDREVMIGR